MSPVNAETYPVVIYPTQELRLGTGIVKRTVVFKPYHTSASPGRLVKTRTAEHQP